MRRRVVITGVGAVTPLGDGVEPTWAALKEGRSGVTGLSAFDASTFSVRVAGMVEDFRLDTRVPRSSSRRLSRAGRFMVDAAVEALDGAGDISAIAPYDRSVVVAGTVGRPSLDDMVEMAETMHDPDSGFVPRQQPGAVQLREQAVTTSVIGSLAEAFGASVNVSTACAGAAHALSEAVGLVASGDAELVVAGGFDSLTTWMDVTGFSLLGALNDQSNDEPARASRPFAADRNGFVLGEGAVCVVVESLESARGRGADIIAEVTGQGTTLNAYRITDSPPDGTGPAEAMSAAIRDAGLRPEDIALVVAHGTGTAGNDASETAAIKKTFGKAAGRLLVSSPKSMAGHLTSAAAGLNLIVAIGALREGIVAPTINLENPDPELDLDYVPLTAREQRVDNAMINAFAFGGTNASIVIGRYSTSEEEQ